MQRILVIGPGGAGKSTLSKQLGAVLGIPVMHLDSMYWKPGWVESDKAEWAGTVRDIVSQPRWVMDGNYSGTLAERVEAADTVIFLEPPRLLCMWRVCMRRWKYNGVSRPDMAPGCPEQVNVEFLSWIWNYQKRSRPKVLSILDRHRSSKNIVHLRSRDEISGFIASLGATTDNSRD